MLEVKKAFDQIANTYDDWYEQPVGRYALKAELKALDHLLPRSGLGADIGAGTGIFAKSLSTDERKIICLDISTKMLSKAVNRKLQPIAGAAESPPIRAESFDFIYMVTLLEFLNDPLRALVSLHELLKPRSPIVILSINRHSPWGKLYTKLSQEGDVIFKHAKFYTPHEVTILLEKADYEIVESTGTLTNPPDVVPEEEPGLWPLTHTIGAGVFLLKGRKK